jgi:hypothetical protein
LEKKGSILGKLNQFGSSSKEIIGESKLKILAKPKRSLAAKEVRAGRSHTSVLGSQHEPSDVSKNYTIDRSATPSSGKRSSRKTGKVLGRMKSGMSFRSGRSIDSDGSSMPGTTKKLNLGAKSQRSVSAKVSYEILPEIDNGSRLSMEDMDPNSLKLKQTTSLETGKLDSSLRTKNLTGKSGKSSRKFYLNKQATQNDKLQFSSRQNMEEKIINSNYKSQNTVPGESRSGRSTNRIKADQKIQVIKENELERAREESLSEFGLNDDKISVKSGLPFQKQMTITINNRESSKRVITELKNQILKRAGSQKYVVLAGIGVEDPISEEDENLNKSK